MKKVFYSRISTVGQSDERQLQNLSGFDHIFSDKCSGTIALFERPKGKQIYTLLQSGELGELHIHSIDRLGRNMVDVLTVWNYLTEKSVKVICRNPSLSNFTANGEKDKFSQLMMGILSTMADFERTLIKERQLEGIRLRKEKGLYSGRKIGTKTCPADFLQSKKGLRIQGYLDKGYVIREISKIVGCSPNTVLKVKHLLKVAQPECRLEGTAG